MAYHRYTLEHYSTPSSRHTCPDCGKKKTFARYIDTESNNEYLADNVGRCNREVECGYHYKPQQFFIDNPDRKPEYVQTYERKPLPPPRPKVNIPPATLQNSLSRPTANNNFIKFLHTLFDTSVVTRLIKTYNIGTGNNAKWWNIPGNNTSTLLWFVNKAGAIRYSEVKLFDTTGHTSKYIDPRKDGDLSSCTTGVHFTLKAGYKDKGQDLPQWLIDYPLQDIYKDCFFGEHLLNNPLYSGLPCAVVEAPKTAIIASVFLPSFVWIAAGSLSCLTPDRCNVLKGRQVYLFPDLGKLDNKEENIKKIGWEQDKGKCFNQWKQRAIELHNVASFTVSDILEKRATPEHRAGGWDLCDYLTGDEVRRELIDDFKNALREAPDDYSNTYIAIWLDYCAKGLRVCDKVTAWKELIDAGEFTPVPDNEIHPHHYNTKTIAA